MANFKYKTGDLVELKQDAKKLMKSADWEDSYEELFGKELSISDDRTDISNGNYYFVYEKDRQYGYFHEDCFKEYKSTAFPKFETINPEDIRSILDTK